MPSPSPPFPPSPLEPNDDGSFEWVEASADNRVQVHLDQADDGRFHVSRLVIEGSPLSAEHLRSIPLGRIEAAANALFHGDPPPVPHTGDAKIAPHLRANAVRGYPESFYDAVAGGYRALVASSSRPIADLAEANEVPLTTAQRWVREARRRGKLPPGRPGKSG